MAVSPPGSGTILKMRPPFKAGSIAGEEFAAPDMPVVTIPCAVEGHADDLSVHIVFRHAGRNMRLVVLERVF